MNSFELGWLVGLLEGEGSFLSPPPSEPNQPRVVLSMTDEDVVRRAAALLGITYVHESRRNLDKWKPAYRFQLKGQRGVELMRKIRPFMGERRGAKIDEILAAYDQRPKHRRLTEEEVRAIKALKGQARARDVALQYDLHIKTVEQIWRGHRWGKLDAALPALQP